MSRSGSQPDERGSPEPRWKKAARRLEQVLQHESPAEALYGDQELLGLLSELRQEDPEGWAVIKAGLRDAGVSTRDLERSLQARSPGKHGPSTRMSEVYRVVDGVLAMSRWGREGRVDVPLCNFDARIIAEEVLDDGADSQSTFAIEGRLPDGTRLPVVEVPAERFSSMSWVPAAWGNRAIVLAGAGNRDHLRTAIQVLSRDIVRRHVYGHLGWRKIDDEWVYLHSGGAVGRQGAVDEVHVRTGSTLQGYVLPSAEEGVEAVRSSLELLDAAPHAITWPLLAGAYRAVLGEALPVDFSVFLVGPTGSKKSALAAVVQAHFGSEFSGRNLPASWASTGNALEKCAFCAKDAVLTVDDFAPTGTHSDVARYHREADRLLRGQGNRRGRSRMSSEGKLRPDYHPRGLIIATGEDIPHGQSLRARLLVLEVGPGDVDLHVLSKLQSAARQGAFVGAMARFIRYLASRMDRLPARLPERLEHHRARARQELGPSHDRTPEIVASLMVGVDTLTTFAEATGGLSDTEANSLQADAWNHLLEAARRQIDHQEADDPARRFVDLINSALVSCEGHVLRVEGDHHPAMPARHGWRAEACYQLDSGEEPVWRPQGRRLGWVDESGNLLLDPDASFAMAQQIATRQGSSLPVQARTLWKRLKESRVLADWDKVRQRNTKRRRIRHEDHEVLVLRWPPAGDLVASSRSSTDGPLDGSDGLDGGNPPASVAADSPCPW